MIDGLIDNSIMFPIISLITIAILYVFVYPHIPINSKKSNLLTLRIWSCNVGILLFGFSFVLTFMSDLFGLETIYSIMESHLIILNLFSFVFLLVMQICHILLTRSFEYLDEVKN